MADGLGSNWNPKRREPVRGICWHWTGGSYVSAVVWCVDPQSKVSYNAIISPKGFIANIAPWSARPWAMGICKSSDPKRFPYADANSAFESIALAGHPPVPPTTEALHALVRLTAERFRAHGWGPDDTWRITTHSAEAWPRGRKDDPDGQHWIDMTKLRAAVATRLRETA